MRLRNYKLFQTEQKVILETSQNLKTVIVTDDYTIKADENYIICNNDVSIIITLPLIDSITEKNLFIIRRINKGNVIIKPQKGNRFNLGETVGDLILSGFDCGVILKAKDSIWYIIQKINCDSPIIFYNSTGYNGYICGGDSNTITSVIDRFQFPFDSGNTIHVGNLSGVRRFLSANNSSVYGYICGGVFANDFSIIDRIYFPFDRGSAIHVNSLTQSRSSLSANNSSTHGYICGGQYYIQTYTYTSIVERFQFSFDNGNVIRLSGVGDNRGGLVANNSTVHGFVCGGYNGTIYFSTVHRFQFPFDSGSAARLSNLNVSREQMAANNSSIHGYICGGRNGTNVYSTVERFQFPFDSGNAIYVGNLSRGRYWLSANNSSTYGYVCGGYSGSSSLSTIDRFQFPFNSGNAIYVGNLSGSRYALSANDETFIPNVMY